MGPYLLDEEFSALLIECRKLLHVSPDSLIIIKENVCDVAKPRKSSMKAAEVDVDDVI